MKCYHVSTGDSFYILEVTKDEDRTSLELFNSNGSSLGSSVYTTVCMDFFYEEELDYLERMSNLDVEEKNNISNLRESLYEKDTMFNIESLEVSSEKCKGIGTLLLNATLFVLKKDLLPSDSIYLNASPYGDGYKIPKNILVSFYQKVGFSEFLDQGSNSMMILKDFNDIKINPLYFFTKSKKKSSKNTLAL